MRKLNPGSLFVLGCIALTGFLSCASGPKAQAPYIEGDDEFAPIAPGGLIYFSIDDVSRARSLLEKISPAGFSPARNREALDRTESLVAALYPEGSGRRFLAAARGRYPGSRAGLSFAFSRDWKKIRSGAGSYWRSEKNRLSVAITSDRAYISDGPPFIPAPGTESPGGLEELRRDAVLAGWVDDAAVPINQFIQSLALPLQIPAERLLFGVYAAEGKKYDAVLNIATPSISQARALVSIFSMARIFLANSDIDPGGPAALAFIFFANTPVQEGTNLIIRTGIMDEDGIALLLNMFSLYSN
ncbi:MAG: hypothetical protein LBO80_01255 [Treponema sp.]|nr:hypothetical protein [Treponema sp.]